MLETDVKSLIESCDINPGGKTEAHMGGLSSMSSAEELAGISHSSAHGSRRRGRTLDGATEVHGGVRPAALTGIGAKQLKHRLIAADAVTVLVGFGLAFLAQWLVRPVPNWILREHVVLSVASLPGFAAGAFLNKLYLARANERVSEEVGNVLRTVIVGVGAMVLVAFAFEYKHLSRFWVLLVGVAVATMLLLERRYVRRLFWQLRTAGRLRRRIVIVGTDPQAIGMLHMYERNPQLGYQVVGLVGDHDVGTRAGVGVVGRLDQLDDVLVQHEAVGVVVSLTSVGHDEVNAITRRLTDAGYHVALSSSLNDIDVTRLRPQTIDGRTMIYVEPIIRHGWRAVAKRTFDIAVASLILLLSAPLWVMAAIAVKIDSPGPVFFRQERVGRNGVGFTLTKFRTMVVDADERKAALESLNEADGPLFKISRDPRITRTGRLLRKFSVDELPQLLAVLRGTMSMVGPRPALPSEVAQWDEQLSERLRVLPGLTGMWQVSGRSNASFDEYKRLDLYYVDNWSLSHDMRICAKTVGTVLSGKGAS